MSTPTNVAILFHGTWVKEVILRPIADGTAVVASNGRTYPAEGGEEIGNSHPRSRMHPWDSTAAWNVGMAQLRQRILGIIAEASLRDGGYIPSWTILALIGEGDLSDLSNAVDQILRQLVSDGLITKVPDLNHRYQLAQPARK